MGTLEKIQTWIKKNLEICGTSSSNTSKISFTFPSKDQTNDGYLIHAVLYDVQENISLKNSPETYFVIDAPPNTSEEKKYELWQLYLFRQSFLDLHYLFLVHSRNETDTTKLENLSKLENLFKFFLKVSRIILSDGQVINISADNLTFQDKLNIFRLSQMNSFCPSLAYIFSPVAVNMVSNIVDQNLVRKIFLSLYDKHKVEEDKKTAEQNSKKDEKSKDDAKKKKDSDNKSPIDTYKVDGPLVIDESFPLPESMLRGFFECTIGQAHSELKAAQDKIKKNQSDLIILNKELETAQESLRRKPNGQQEKDIFQKAFENVENKKIALSQSQKDLPVVEESLKKSFLGFPQNLPSLPEFGKMRIQPDEKTERCWIISEEKKTLYKIRQVHSNSQVWILSAIL